MITCTRRLEIDAGHRLMKHQGKCKNYHGHRYAFEITCEAPLLEGMVVDFGIIKQEVGGWLDRYWDHGMILQEQDPLTNELQLLHSKVYVMPRPPTAENLADEVLFLAERLLTGRGLRVVQVRCFETPNCWADAFADK